MTTVKVGEITFKLLSVAKATTPQAGQHMIYTDQWWVTDGENLYFADGFAPQTNPDRGIAEMIRDRLLPGLSVLQIPVVYVPIHAPDYSVRIPACDAV